MAKYNGANDEAKNIPPDFKNTEIQRDWYFSVVL